jgi:hypothetical protein
MRQREDGSLMINVDVPEDSRPFPSAARFARCTSGKQQFSFQEERILLCCCED